MPTISYVTASEEIFSSILDFNIYSSETPQSQLRTPCEQHSKIPPLGAMSRNDGHREPTANGKVIQDNGNVKITVLDTVNTV